jgi:hypothetical protein
MHVFRREHGSVEWDTIEIPEGGLRVSRAADGALEFTEKNAPGALAAFLLFEENNVQRAALVPGAHTVGVWRRGADRGRAHLVRLARTQRSPRVHCG